MVEVIDALCISLTGQGIVFFHKSSCDKDSLEAIPLGQLLADNLG